MSDERTTPPYDLAHELWALAQCTPGEGIEDAVLRIAARLQHESDARAERIAEREDKLNATADSRSEFKIEADKWFVRHNLVKAESAKLREALEKWDAAARAAEACNEELESTYFDEDKWNELSEEHERLLGIAERARIAALAGKEPK